MERMRNFSIGFSNTVVSKSADRGNRLGKRLEAERMALEIVGLRLPEMVPKIIGFGSVENPHQILLSYIDNLGKDGSFETFREIIDTLQSIPVDNRLPTITPRDYDKDAHRFLRYLKQQGFLIGLTQREVEALINNLFGNYEKYLAGFSTVFVHGDMQSRHVAKNGTQVSIIDFEKTHYGSELEDWASLSIRHPGLANRIRQHLENKFEEDSLKFDNFNAAFRLLQTHYLLGAYFTIAYLNRGTLFDIVAKIYARIAINLRIAV